MLYLLVLQSLCKLVRVGYSNSDIYLHLAPLFHVGALSSALAVLLAGGTHVMMPRWAGSGRR
jgi:acyl-activating enzyme 14